MVLDTFHDYVAAGILPFGRRLDMTKARLLSRTVVSVLAITILGSCGPAATTEHPGSRPSSNRETPAGPEVPVVNEHPAGEESASESRIVSEAEVVADMKTIAEGNTAFAIALYGQLRGEEGNLFISPYSISTALAMTYAGASGNTEKQMADVLRFSIERNRLHTAFGRLEAELNALQEEGNVELSVANALWAQKGHVFLEEFLDLLAKSYGAALNLVDFKKIMKKRAERLTHGWRTRRKTRLRI